MSTTQQLPTISPDALIAHLDDETVVLHLGTKQYFHLNASAQRIWSLLEEGVTEDGLAQRLCAEFEVAPETVKDEVRSLLKTLREYGLVEDGAITTAG